MRVSTASWQALMIGSVVVWAAGAHPAFARTKAAGAAPIVIAHARSAVEHGRPAPVMPIVFHAGTFKASIGHSPTKSAGSKFANPAPGGRYQITIHGSKVSMSNGVFYTSRFKNSLSKTGKARFGVSRYSGRSAYNGGSSYGSDGDGYEASLQCVPFARAASGIELKGNAAEWWYAAAGVYERGASPEPGSVLNFRSTGNMRLGHVAVVSGVISQREIEVDHANWAGAGNLKGGVARGVHVVDVSPDNDWSAVRVALPGSSDYGSVYPTYGFIYDRPDNGGAVMASARGRMNVKFRSSEVAEAPIR